MTELLEATTNTVLNRSLVKAFKKIENIKVIGNICGTQTFSSFCLDADLSGALMDFTLAKVRERAPELRGVEIAVRCTANGEPDNPEIVETLANCWGVHVSRHQLAVDVLASVGIHHSETCTLIFADAVDHL